MHLSVTCGFQHLSTRVKKDTKSSLVSPVLLKSNVTLSVPTCALLFRIAFHKVSQTLQGFLQKIKCSNKLKFYSSCVEKLFGDNTCLTK